MEQPHVVVTLSRISSGRYVVAGSRPALELRMSRWRYRGEAQVGVQTYRLRRTGILDRGVAVLAPDDTEVLSLSRKHPNVPGLPDCEFRVRSRWRGYEAQLVGPGDVGLVVRIGHGTRSEVTAQITGALPSRDLVLLAAAFAVLLRRREDTEAAGGATAAAVAATS
jgi:hypothetical protein